ncbi:MAG: hypothetical protein IJ514_06200 [Clostridia bacterium]|nr:hypothetical protein [Clostridia bacterium]
MMRKGNYETPTMRPCLIEQDDLVRTSIELTDGVAIKFNDAWLGSGANGGVDE